MAVKKPWYVRAKNRLRLFSDKLDKFLGDAEKEEIARAIRQAENRTSAEIRVYIEHRCRGDALQRAGELFDLLGMANTKEKNGALIYIAVGDRKLAVIGDSGIDRQVTPEFWQQVEKQIESEFAQGRFCRGICLGIELLGEKLKQLFPRRPDDVNELSDEISFGK